MQTSAGDLAPARVARLPSWLLTQTAAHAHRLIGERLAAVDARGHHYRLLATLVEHGPASQADLGRRTGIHFSDVVTALNELAARGLIDRSPDPADRRRNVITITPAGRDRLRVLDRTVARVQEELLAPLSPEERDQLVRLLSRLLAHHAGRAGGGPAAG